MRNRNNSDLNDARPSDVNDSLNPRLKCEWTGPQLTTFINDIQVNSAHLPEKDKEEKKKKWKNIRQSLLSSDEFKYLDEIALRDVSYQIPEWTQLIKKYRSLVKEVFQKYEITLDDLDVPLLVQTYSKLFMPWELVLIKLEYECYRKHSMYPTDESRKLWKKENKINFNSFVLLAFILATIDTIIVAFDKANPVAYRIQLLVLGLSIVVFIYGFVKTITYFPSDYELKIDRFIYAPFLRFSYDNNALRLIEKARLCIDRDVILESLCYILGVVYLALDQPGLAALRVFRIFRFFSYFKFLESKYVDAETPPAKRHFSLVKAAKLCSFYMEQMFEEFCTQRSLGSLLIITMFFFTAFVMGAVFKNTKPELCPSLTDCFFTMFRLVVYDGNGIDELLRPLFEDGDGGLIFLIFLFMLFNCFVLYNGIIGTFAKVFTTSDDVIEETHSRIENIESKIEYLHDFMSSIKPKDSDENGRPSYLINRPVTIKYSRNPIPSLTRGSANSAAVPVNSWRNHHNVERGQRGQGGQGADTYATASQRVDYSATYDRASQSVIAETNPSMN